MKPAIVSGIEVMSALVKALTGRSRCPVCHVPWSMERHGKEGCALEDAINWLETTRLLRNEMVVSGLDRMDIISDELADITNRLQIIESTMSRWTGEI